jgi:ABC-type amino acid transport substrate-binding protein
MIGQSGSKPNAAGPTAPASSTEEPVNSVSPRKRVRGKESFYNPRCKKLRCACLHFPSILTVAGRGALALYWLPLMKASRVYSWLVLVFICLAPFRGGVAAEAAPLRVGITPVFPPMIFKEGGKVAGVEADFARALGQELSRPIKFVEVDWEDHFTALTENRTDIIMSSMSITRAREFRAAFAKPYLGIGQMALVRREDAHKYTFGFPTRPEGHVGVRKGTTGDFLVQQEFPHAKRKNYNSAEQGAKALAKKQIGLFISDSPTVLWLEGMNEETGLVAVPIQLSQESLAWAVRKSDSELLAAVNQSLEKLHTNGTAAAIIRRWIPNRK